MGFSLKVPLASNGFSQEEVFQHEILPPSHQRTTADPTCYPAIGYLMPSFDFDHLVKRTALRASE